MINVAIIGSGIGLKHFEAINGYRKSKVKIICEKNSKKVKELKLRYKNIKVISNENEIFRSKEINLVSIASYDDDHFHQIKKLKSVFSFSDKIWLFMSIICFKDK